MHLFDSVILGGEGEAGVVGAYEGTEWTLMEVDVLEAEGC